MIKEQKLYMSNLENKPIHKLFRVTLSSNKYAKNTNTDVLSLYVYNNSPYKKNQQFLMKNYTFTRSKKYFLHILGQYEVISPVHQDQ